LFDVWKSFDCFFCTESIEGHIQRFVKQILYFLHSREL